MRALEANDTDLEAGAAYVIGIAASNNVHFQKALIDACPQVFHLLVKAAVLCFALWLALSRESQHAGS